MFEDLYEGQPPSRHLDVKWEDSRPPKYMVIAHLPATLTIDTLFFNSWKEAHDWVSERGITAYSIHPVKP